MQKVISRCSQPKELIWYFLKRKIYSFCLVSGWTKTSLAHFFGISFSLTLQAKIWLSYLLPRSLCQQWHMHKGEWCKRCLGLWEFLWWPLLRFLRNRGSTCQATGGTLLLHRGLQNPFWGAHRHNHTFFCHFLTLIFSHFYLSTDVCIQ